MRPVVSSGASSTTTPAPARSRAGSGRVANSRTASGVRVRHMARGADDGFHSQLVPGLRSSADAERLAEELAFATARLSRLSVDPPGLYAEVAARESELEERTWLAF